jgi:hypothetical protein
MWHRNPVVSIVSAGVVALLGVAVSAHAQSIAPSSSPEAIRVASNLPARAGRVQGSVKDPSGVAIGDASILAVGQTVVSARSDAAGRFHLALPPGDYVLRASRDGYVSTYREPVRVQSHTRLERTITLTRQGDAAVTPAAGQHAHTELAWLLRHLPRSVLRDESGTTYVRRQPAEGRASWLDLDLTGQVNFVTTASASSFATAPESALARGVAFVVIGAPVGSWGDWRVRGAISASPGAPWNVLAEYESRASELHAIKGGASFSTQSFETGAFGPFDQQVRHTRSVAGVYASDRWRALPVLEIEYGGRADRYDYLRVPNLFSGHAGVRAALPWRTFVEVRGSQTKMAPGAGEFLPPSESGPWLPAERTFSSFDAREPLIPETVVQFDAGGGVMLDVDGLSLLRLRVFRQDVTDQMATLFDIRTTAGPGHYRVARTGDVRLEGWSVAYEGTLLPRVAGRVEYSQMRGEWNLMGRTRGLRRSVPSVLRPDLERVHDLVAELEASIRSATRLTVLYRVSSAYSAGGERRPRPGGRFDIELHQGLPYQPGAGSQLELIFAVRTLFRDTRERASFYDELLTVRPPLRLMGGIQLRF